MKQLLAVLLALCLPALAAAQEPSAENGTPILLTMGELTIPAILNDTSAAQDLLTRLPYTLTVTRGGADIHGELDEPLAYASSDGQQAWQAGDLLWSPESNRFAFFTDEAEDRGDGSWIVLGHMDETWEQVRDWQDAMDITISRLEDHGMNRQIDIEINGQIRTATLQDNRSAEAFLALLTQGPLTIDMRDYGSFEKVGPLGTELPRSDEPITTTPGDIILYQGNSVTIYYAVNSWNFTLLGHIDGATGESMRAFLGGGNPSVTFSLHAEEK